MSEAASGVPARERASSALVLDAHSNAGLACVQSLGRRGVAVDVASDRDCLAFRSRYCRQRFSQPAASDVGGYLGWLHEIAAGRRWRLVIASTEASLRCLLELPEDSPLRTAAVLPSNEALRIALSKRLTLERADALAIPFPRSRCIASAAEAGPGPQGFPVVLKPVTSVVLHEDELLVLQPSVARTLRDRERALERLLPHGPVLEQEFVAGVGVAIECLYVHGARVWHFQHERLHEAPLSGGASSYRRSAVADPLLLEQATRLLDSLAWHGVAMVEFKGDVERGYRLMEINPRLWGSLPLAIGAGVDFPWGLWSIAAGLEPGPQPAYRASWYARNLRKDLEWLKENLRADHSDPSLLTRPRLRSLLEYLRPLVGSEGWDHFDRRDWRVGARVVRDCLIDLIATGRSVADRWTASRRIARHHRSIVARLDSMPGDAPLRVLFVCHGNICRSALADLYARHRGAGIETLSAGFHPRAQRPSPGWFQAIAAEHGVDLSTWRSRTLEREQVDWADLILLADRANLDRFGRAFPDALGKTTMLGLFSNPPSISIDDPFVLDHTSAVAAAGEVIRATEGLLARLRTIRNPQALSGRIGRSARSRSTG